MKKKAPEEIPKDSSMDWDSIVNQIYDTIGTDTAIINRYGIVLASKIKGFEKDHILSPVIWESISNRVQLNKELKTQTISCFVLESDKGNIVISLGQNIYLMSIIPSEVELAKFMPSLTGFISTLDKTADKDLGIELKNLELEEEYQELTKHKIEDKSDNFPVFKDLIKYLSKES